MQISDGRGRRPPTAVGVRKLRVITISYGIKISTVHCLILSQSMRVMDGQTDGHNYDSQDRTSIAASRGKKKIIHSEDNN